MMNDIILIALEDESPNLKKYSNVFFTGIGKINATNVCTEVIVRYKPKRIFNFGTAGGITVSNGLHKIGKFVQRDMLCVGLGFPEGVTPLEDDSGVIRIGDGLTCSSGDNFVTNNSLTIPADVVDMEGYALAKICKKYNVEFQCFKYITDDGDENASKDWKVSVSSGEQFYIEKIKEFKINLK